MSRHPTLACLVAIGLLLGAPPDVQARGTPSELGAKGRPDVSLDRLIFPKEIAGAHHFEKRLRKILKREARRADWGAGRGSKISYRFAVTELVIEPQKDVLRVRCTAVGRLPGGKSARSNLTFGGDPRHRNKVVERVLEIVARGVMTRLAELERVRRGADR